MADYSNRLKKNMDVKLSTEEETKNESSGTFANILGKMKGYVHLNSADEEGNISKQTEELSYGEKIKTTLLNCLEVEKSYTVFFIVFAVGLGLIFLSLMFLPIVILSPHKFVSLFSLGSLITLFSFIFIYGTKDYFVMLFSHERRIFSSLFFISILTGIYFAFYPTYYLISLICSVIQMITVIVFVLSFIPGGGAGISFIMSMVMSPIQSILNRFKSQS